MDTKIFEVRDRMTFIPVLAIRMSPTCEADRYLLARCGYGRTPEEQTSYIYLLKLNEPETGAHRVPAEWSTSRTLRIAHAHIVEHFDEWPTGHVVDIEFLLGESARPKASEAANHPF